MIFTMAQYEEVSQESERKDGGLVCLCVCSSVSVYYMLKHKNAWNIFCKLFHFATVERYGMIIGMQFVPVFLFQCFSSVQLCSFLFCLIQIYEKCF